MRVRSAVHLVSALVTLSALVSCASAKKRNQAGNDAPLLRALVVNEDELDEETVARLKDIADDPSSNLPLEEAPVGEETMLLAAESDDGKPLDPVAAWTRSGFDPRSITPGDIFTENSGPILNKTLSLADSLGEDQREKLLKLYASAGTMRVPMTISAEELVEIQARAAAVGSAPELPTRSVALDFRALTYSADPAKLEALYADLAREEGAASEGFPFPDSTRERITEIKKRLENGEKLYVVTGVTESDSLVASYPGAPIGKRDAEPIRNAVQGMFPHLDGLEAEKLDRSVVLSGRPRVLWEFEAKELKLENGRIAIDSNSLVQL